MATYFNYKKTIDGVRKTVKHINECRSNGWFERVYYDTHEKKVFSETVSDRGNWKSWESNSENDHIVCIGVFDDRNGKVSIKELSERITEELENLKREKKYYEETCGKPFYLELE